MLERAAWAQVPHRERPLCRHPLAGGKERRRALYGPRLRAWSSILAALQQAKVLLCHCGLHELLLVQAGGGGSLLASRHMPMML